ncbi:hypothetical protein R2F61_02340 [Mollicutes bacterium LVI A0078]|nr:hypothetical protein RZE84_02370 [Mollicutes bacterium LVI A0075]WOO91408.1 hypothetical protein R2F61_02340 [Mollicutes bacterium LVI A0078]
MDKENKASKLRSLEHKLYGLFAVVLVLAFIVLTTIFKAIMN